MTDDPKFKIVHPDTEPAEPIAKPSKPVTAPSNPFANLDALRNPQDYEEFLGSGFAADCRRSDPTRRDAPAG